MYLDRPLKLLGSSPSSYCRSLRRPPLTSSESSAGFLLSFSWSIETSGENSVKFFFASQVEFFLSQNFQKKLENECFQRPCNIRVYCSMLLLLRFLGGRFSKYSLKSSHQGPTKPICFPVIKILHPKKNQRGGIFHFSIY